MNRIIQMIIVFCVTWIQGATASIPKNNIYIPVGLKSSSGLTEVEFNEESIRLTKAYEATLNTIDAKLDIIRDWNDGEVNAYAHQKKGKNIFSIEVFGGLARHPQMDKETFMMVLCHELGHHLGGAPKKIIEEEDDVSDRGGRNKGFWGSKKEIVYSFSSVEGQADYFATLKCFKTVNFIEDNEKFVLAQPEFQNLSQANKDLCYSVYKNRNEQFLCMRSLLASDKLVYFMQMITRKTVRASLNLADQSLVKSIIREYPSLQCRLDTLKSGTVCDVPMTDRLSNSDSSAGVCGEGIGKRPRCWFKPGTP